MFTLYHYIPRSALVAQMVKNPPAMQKTRVQIPVLGKSPEEGKGNPSSIVACLVPGVTKSRTRLSDSHFSIFCKWVDDAIRKVPQDATGLFE